MKNIFWSFIITTALLALIVVFFVNYVLRAAPVFQLNEESHIELGISIVEQDFSTISNQSEVNSLPQDARTVSFLLQSPNPTAQIYLDYVAVYNVKDIPVRVCFKSITIPRSENVPFEIVPNVVLGNLIISSDLYQYDFPSGDENRCIGKGAEKIMPHVLLGIVPIESFVNFHIIPPVDQRFDAFPFDEQTVELNITIDSDELGKFSPSIKAVIAQEGWTGKFNSNRGEKPVLHLYRHPFFQFMLVLFVLIMLFIIPLLNGVINESASFFEVAFSILLGLWGLHTILIPEYIQSSLVIDGVFYVLYIIVLLSILQELLRLSVLNWIKKNIRIVHVEYDPPGNDIDGEYVEIINKSIFPLNMTDWNLFDKAKTKFTFPYYILHRNNSVKIWAKGGQNDRVNLYWGRKKPIWNNNSDTAILEDKNGNIIDSYSYVKK